VDRSGSGQGPVVDSAEQGNERFGKFVIGRYEEHCLLGYNAVYSVESLRKFRRNLPPPSYLSILKMKICSSEKSVNFQRKTRRYISEENHGYDNFKSYTCFFVTSSTPGKICQILMEKKIVEKINKILRLHIGLAEYLGGAQLECRPGNPQH
jgi:hypothetical protein